MSTLDVNSPRIIQRLHVGCFTSTLSMRERERERRCLAPGLMRSAALVAPPGPLPPPPPAPGCCSGPWDVPPRWPSWDARGRTLPGLRRARKKWKTSLFYCSCLSVQKSTKMSKPVHFPVKVRRLWLKTSPVSDAPKWSVLGLKVLKYN